MADQEQHHEGETPMDATDADALTQGGDQAMAQDNDQPEQIDPASSEDGDAEESAPEGTDLLKPDV